MEEAAEERRGKEAVRTVGSHGSVDWTTRRGDWSGRSPLSAAWRNLSPVRFPLHLHFIAGGPSQKQANSEQ
jgi:hypothetical protein